RPRRAEQRGRVPLGVTAERFGEAAVEPLEVFRGGGLVKGDVDVAAVPAGADNERTWAGEQVKRRLVGWPPWVVDFAVKEPRGPGGVLHASAAGAEHGRGVHVSFASPVERGLVEAAPIGGPGERFFRPG